MSVNTEPLGGSVTDPGGISKVSPPLLGHIPTLVRHSRRSVRGNLNRPSTKKQSRAASAPLSMFGDRPLETFRKKLEIQQPQSWTTSASSSPCDREPSSADPRSLRRQLISGERSPGEARSRRCCT